MEELSKLRDEISSVDRELIELFEKRMEIVMKIGEYKNKMGIPILNTDREKQVINLGIEQLKNKKFSIYLEEFLQNLMNVSKKLQKDKL